MNPYLIVKLIHIIGALGFFMVLGLEWFSLSQARNAATAEQIRERLQISRSSQRLGPLSMLTILITGFYMMATTWHGVAWLIVTFGALVLIVALGAAVTAPRMAAIGRALLAATGPISSTLHDLLHNALLWLSLRIRVSIALGIVVLMTLKPALLGSLITLAVAIALALAFSLPARSRDREKVRV